MRDRWVSRQVMSGKMDGEWWVDVWMCGWMDGSRMVHGQIDGEWCMDVWMDRQMDGEW